MEGISFSELLTAAVVLLVFIGAYNTISSAIKNRREQRKWQNQPLDDLTARVDKHDDLLARDKARLDALETEMKAMSEQSRITMRGIKALLSHEINGNSDDKLRASLEEIDDFLLKR